MAEISIHNETQYELTPAILDQIKRDALEYFGDSVRTIKVLYGIERHAFNARTGEMRYAFSPGDFGLVDTTLSYPDTFLPRDVPRIDDDTDGEEEDVDEAAFEDVELDEEDEEETSLDNLAEELVDDVDDDEEDVGFHRLSSDFDDFDADDKTYLFEDETENDL